MYQASNEIEKFKKDHQKKKIVFTNGCFDILHAGHVAYLKEASDLGDLLVLGLNSDSSVRKLKGESRPINNELDRKFVMEALRSVSFVEIFSQDTPCELIAWLRPDIYVKGGDYDITKIPEYKIVKSYGGELKSLNFVEGKSSTNIISKIRTGIDDK